ncbi:hypothetical protein ACFU5O_03505 [Streptomyces sp. NPDC057445]|uniref:hypothetical protein n=1 Tax=Streptomyces sp. NPDC057445 TaxID=3346136 RepID=UPI00369AA1CA
MPRRSRWRVALAATTISLIVAVPVVAAEPAFAQYPPTPGLTIDDNTVSPGDDINHTATGYQPGELAIARLVPGSTPGDGDDDRPIVVLGHFTADANGIVTGRVIIPRRIRPGTYLFQLVGQKSELTLSAQVTVFRDHDGDGGALGSAGEGDDEHGRDKGDDERGGHGSDRDKGSFGRGNGAPPELAHSGSPDPTVALLTAAGGLVILGGGTLVISKRRRAATEHG